MRPGRIPLSSGTVAVLFAAALALTPSVAYASEAGTVYTWGAVDSQTSPLRFPQRVEPLTEVTEIDAGNSSAYALEKNGTVWAWGQNEDGELGNGTVVSSASAVHVNMPAGVKIVSIGESQDSGLAVDSTGHGWAWGLRGASCNPGANAYTATPQEVQGLGSIVSVQGGEHHSLWLTSSGTIYACGTNAQGQLGVPNLSSTSTPVRVPGLGHVVEISAGERTSCARTSNGEIYVWGADNHGQVGNGQFREEVTSPYHVPLPGPASEISCGGNLPTNGHTLAVVGGTLYGWGADAFGQVGDGAEEDKSLPVDTGMNFETVVASGVSSFGIEDGVLFSWGNHASGILGTGSARDALEPEEVESGVTQVSSTAHIAAYLYR
ncbi:MAG TPA: hypothetical protein VMA83_11140 [Solirubrobacteraceae bacterium]|nr:hypothetical protein [Solirubrobacteraceae bacterium]